MLGTRKYWNRDHAGRQLARALRRFSMAQPIVVAVSGEGVLVARQVSERLNCDMDALVVVDVVAPDDSGVIIGAVSEGGVSVIDRSAVPRSPRNVSMIEALVQRGMSDTARHVVAMRSGKSLIDVSGRLVIVVDDAIASGIRMSAATTALRRLGAAHIVAASPVGNRTSIENLQTVADEVICPAIVTENRPVSDWYEEDEHMSDADMAAILRMAARHEVVIEVGDPHGRGWQVHGTLSVPRGAAGVVIFAHGSGSSRWSPRNQEVAAALNEAGFATVLFDLLTEEEGSDRRLVFDIEYLAARLIAVIDWAAQDERLRDIPIGLFGASTGAAAALVAAARRSQVIRAVVCRGGRPDLAEGVLADVQAPTLLIVGGHDEQVLRLNETALAYLGNTSRMDVIPGATHLFEETGALERVSLLAASWFDEFFTASERVSGSLIRYRRTS